MGSRPEFRMRRPARARMLAAVALTGAAALLSACAAQSPMQTAAPTSPTATGAEPVPIADDRLQSLSLGDRVAADGVAVLWAEPGETLAVVIGGSGGGGDCIPQPGAAALVDGRVTIAFDPPDPAVMCTADYRLHGWELGLPEPVDPEGILDVDLSNLSGDDATTAVRVGPDDLLVTPTADPQPSVVPGEPAAGAPAPTPIPAAQLPDSQVLDWEQRPMAAAQWIEPGTTLAVMIGGSGVEACVPQPVGGWSTGVGTVEVAFAYPADAGDCSADLHVYGWSVTLPEPVVATLPIEVTITGAEHDGAAAVVTVDPEDVFAQP